MEMKWRRIIANKHATENSLCLIFTKALSQVIMKSYRFIDTSTDTRDGELI